jgi:hypothetical protein
MSEIWSVPTSARRGLLVSVTQVDTDHTDRPTIAPHKAQIHSQENDMTVLDRPTVTTRVPMDSLPGMVAKDNRPVWAEAELRGDDR